MPELTTIAGRLHVYTTAVDAWWSNHVFFDTEKLGTVVYDVPILNDDGEALWREIRARTRGDLRTIIVSHGHPDHWGSLDFFQTVVPDAAIISGQETAYYLFCTGEPNLQLSRDWQPQLTSIPKRVVMPTVLFEGEKVLDGGDLTLRLYTTGPAEDSEHVVLHIPELEVVLANDLIYNGWHPWNELERDGHWLRVLDWLRSLEATTVVPGHGRVCGPEIYDVMEEWLRAYQDLRLKYAGRYSMRDMPPENRRQMMAELRALHPDWIAEEIPFSCGATLAVPYSHGPNRYSVEAFAPREVDED